MANYLYNSVELPELPEWDKTVYPYAFIVDMDDDVFELHLLKGYKFTSGLGGAENWSVQHIPYESVPRYIFEPGENEWEYGGTALSLCVISIIKWANFNIRDKNGDIYLPASYPIDPETGEEIRIYDPNYIPVGSAPKLDPHSLMLGWLYGHKVLSMVRSKLAPGLYKTGTNNLIYSWEQLLGDELRSGGILHVTNGVLTGNYIDDTNYGMFLLKGDLVLPTDGSVTEIGDYTFWYGEFITNITICDKITSIGQYAFDGCKRITIFNIPDSVTTIGQRAFRDCWAIINIVIPPKVTIIGGGTFGYCSSLKKVLFHDGVTDIGERAFFCCVNLTEITLPSGLTHLGYQAFEGCTALERITFEGTVEQWNAISFDQRWHENVPATEVICSDGTVYLS